MAELNYNRKSAISAFKQLVLETFRPPPADVIGYGKGVVTTEKAIAFARSVGINISSRADIDDVVAATKQALDRFAPMVDGSMMRTEIAALCNETEILKRKRDALQNEIDSIRTKNREERMRPFELLVDIEIQKGRFPIHMREKLIEKISKSHDLQNSRIALANEPSVPTGVGVILAKKH